MFDLFQSKIIAHLPPAPCGLAPVETAKLQHWRGFPGIFVPGAAPVLEFDLLPAEFSAAGEFHYRRYIIPSVFGSQMEMIG